MKFIPGDTVKYNNKIVKYRIELSTRGALRMRHCISGEEYSIPHNADGRLIKVGHDDTYRVPIENLRRYMKLVPSARASAEMRAFVNNRMHGIDSKMDTSGFDALKSASDGSTDDVLDAMKYAKSAMQGGFDIGKEEAERLLHDYRKAFPSVAEYCKTNNMNKENTMSISINSLVAKVTNNIKDAQLVTQYFGHELIESSIKDEFFVRDNYTDLLKEAKARDKKKLAAENSCVQG